MVPVLKKDVSGYIRAKITHLIEKQEKYLTGLNKIHTTDFTDIDYINNALGIPMREIIMQLDTLRTFDKHNKPLKVFTSIDYTEWPQPGYTLTYPKHLQDEAAEYASSIPSFLHWCYGDNVLDMLTPDAIH